ncbi:MAG: LLM class flavin-dependent oxidoreductase [Caulobacterales bacterium]
MSIDNILRNISDEEIDAFALRDDEMILAVRGFGASIDISRAEAAGFDFVLIDSGAPERPVGGDALSQAAYAMARTTHIGLAVQISTDWAPYNVARALASFDLLSGGRLGWEPVRPGDQSEAAFLEHIDIVHALFDTWDDDALVFNKETSIFADHAKVRRIQHNGAYYSVDGPLNAPRPIQGHPVLFARSDALCADIAFAANNAQEWSKAAKVMYETAIHGNAERSTREAFEIVRAQKFDGVCFSVSGFGEFHALIHAIESSDIAKNVWRDTISLRTRLGLARPINQFAVTS